MKLIYKASDIIEAHIVAGLLNANGVEAHVGGHYLQGGVGELAAFGFANVHVADEDTSLAKSIIAEYQGEQGKPEKTRHLKKSCFTPKEPLINLSCRRMPVSKVLKTLDPGMRRDDDKGINQSLPKLILVALVTLFIGYLYHMVTPL